jgi:hypothetical protein
MDLGGEQGITGAKTGSLRYVIWPAFFYCFHLLEVVEITILPLSCIVAPSTPLRNSVKP